MLAGKTDALDCPHCGLGCSSKSGLSLHVKKCKQRTREEHKVTDIDPRTSVEEFEINPYAPPGQKPEKPKHKDSNQPFDFGAFAIMSDHIPIFLDVNFAITLGEFILKHGADNRALMAFAYQLRNLDGNDE